MRSVADGEKDAVLLERSALKRILFVTLSGLPKIQKKSVLLECISIEFI